MKKGRGTHSQAAAPPPSASPSPQFPRTSRGALAAVAGLLLIHLGLAVSFIASASPTYDEPVHLAAGYSYWKTGRLRLNIMDHPPLAEMTSALPLLALNPALMTSSPEWQAGRLYHFADKFLFTNRVPAERLMRWARLFTFVLWSALLAVFLLRWARRLGGDEAMVGAAAVYAFSPALLSNLPLVATDGASAVLAFAACALLAEGGGPRRWAAAGVCAGLANAAKFNMILLPGIVLACLLTERESSPEPKPTVPWAGLAAFAGAGILALAAAYGFGQFPLYWKGLGATLARLDEGRSAFFFGRYSTQGFLLYFPAALLVKTPLAALALAGVGVWAILRKARAGREYAPGAAGEESLRARGAGRDNAPGTAGKEYDLSRGAWAFLPAALYLAAAMRSKVDIGYRHVLPVVPFMILWAGAGAGWLWTRGRGAAALCAALLAWQAGSVLRLRPHYLAYFNELVGGPAGGLRALADSNLDWGQDLPGLARELRRLGDPPVYLSYFGTADPSYYGIKYVPVAMPGTVERAGDAVDPAASGRVLLAVSATNLQCVYFADKTLFDWIRTRAPLEVIGHSIYLYDLTGDKDAYRRLAALLAASGNPKAAAALSSR
ncbi:MAG: glycosyltransferase family 39 protein [Proteobacteria bacterium]|nr:glycosyltransferase family 39 protein [Pseudomonadota bacterium]